MAQDFDPTTQDSGAVGTPTEQTWRPTDADPTTGDTGQTTENPTDAMLDAFNEDDATRPDREDGEGTTDWESGDGPEPIREEAREESNDE